MAFPTTCWTVLAQATLHGDDAGRDALASLCKAYRPPVIGYLMARGVAEDEARDRAQDFFLKLLESRAWKRADQSRGRFRSFLLGMVNHLMQQEVRNGTRQKRGGGVAPLSVEDLECGGLELPAPDSAETWHFDREWARTLVSQVLRELESDYLRRGQKAEFAVVRRYLPGAQAPLSYEEAAEKLGLSLMALKSCIHRLRQRFRESLRSTVARTVNAPHEVDEELRYLGRLLMEQSPSAHGVATNASSHPVG